jgi:ketosteroid isomerase-like protein
MSERDPEVQKLIDESAIRNLLDKYPRALDRQDHELLASLFHPGAIDDHGVYNGSAAGYVDWVRGWAVPGNHWMHHNGTRIIEIDGDVAFVETYCLAFCRQSEEGKEGEKEMFLRVRYLDRVEKRNGEWRIAHRRVVYSPCQIVKVTEEFPFDDEVTLMEGGYPEDEIYKW